MGKLLRARKHLEVVLSRHHPERDGPLLQFGIDPKVNCLGYAGMTLWILGYPDQALSRGKEGLDLARALSHPNSLASIENFLGIIHQFRREAAATQKEAERQAVLSAEHGLGLWLPLAKILRGWVLAAQGRVEEGIAQMREGLADYQATGAGIGLTYHLCSLAEAYIWASHFNDASRVLEEAMVGANKTDERHYEAEIHRLKGELLLQRDPSNPKEALTSFQRAIAIARNQSAKSWELRATTSLARLLAKENRGDEARAMLAEIYNWFTEGFDTADLRDAKALLEELSK